MASHSHLFLLSLLFRWVARVLNDHSEDALSLAVVCPGQDPCAESRSGFAFDSRLPTADRAFHFLAPASGRRHTSLELAESNFRSSGPSGVPVVPITGRLVPSSRCVDALVDPAPSSCLCDSSFPQVALRSTRRPTKVLVASLQCMEGRGDSESISVQIRSRRIRKFRTFMRPTATVHVGDSRPRGSLSTQISRDFVGNHKRRGPIAHTV
jgi:hypothetical protein